MDLFGFAGNLFGFVMDLTIYLYVLENIPYMGKIIQDGPLINQICLDLIPK